MAPCPFLANVLPQPYEHYTYYAIVLLPFVSLAGVIHFLLPVSRMRGFTGAVSILLFAAALTGLGVVYVWADAVTPLVTAHGQIVSAKVHGRRSKSTTIRLLTDDGRFLQLEANGTRDRFAAGQKIEVRYQKGGGAVREATYLSDEGMPQGTYRSYEWSYLLLLFLIAGTAGFTGIYNYREDPLGLASASVRQAEAYKKRLSALKRRHSGVST